MLEEHEFQSRCFNKLFTAHFSVPNVIFIGLVLEISFCMSLNYQPDYLSLTELG